MTSTPILEAAGPLVELGGFSLRIPDGGHPARAAILRRMAAFRVADGSRQSIESTLSLTLPSAGESGLLPHAEVLTPRFHTSDDSAQVSLSAPGFHGSISAKGDAAQLRLDPSRPVEDLEYFIRLIGAQAAFAQGGLMLHAAAVVSRGGAQVFFGPSGSGKTTLARNAGPRALLNDDLVVLLPEAEGEGYRVHATPFSNATQVAPTGPASAPLAGLHRLEHAPQNALQPMRRSLALASLAACAPLIAADPARAAQVLARIEQILSFVPADTLQLLPDERFWALLEQGSHS
jgi:hypothetical protein